MNNVPSILGRSLVLSIALHAVLIFAGLQLAVPSLRVEPPVRSDLKVSLREPPAAPAPAAPPQPVLELPRQAPPPVRAPQRNASAGAPVVATAGASPRRLEGEAALRAMEQLSRELPYPPEAVQRGLEGEALVLLFLDADGNAIAARLEASSGHGLLDDAAVRAVRTLRSLPGNAPREALVPVRFRLR